MNGPDLFPTKKVPTIVPKPFTPLMKTFLVVVNPLENTKIDMNIAPSLKMKLPVNGLVSDLADDHSPLR